MRICNVGLRIFQLTCNHCCPFNKLKSFPLCSAAHKRHLAPEGVCCLSRQYVTASRCIVNGCCSKASETCKHHPGCFWRPMSTSSEKLHKNDRRNTSILLYFSGIAILVVGFSYAAVPLYRIFCQATGYGGEVSRGHDASKVEHMQKVDYRKITVHFNADLSSSMAWKFVPQQTEVIISPGETALAFYTATNPLDRPVIGIATYNVIPFEAGQYFNKIQCFCFEEQRLNANEQVDMPVFFYVDPDFADDPKLEYVNDLTLSYTFFEAKDGVTIPIPSYAR